MPSHPPARLVFSVLLWSLLLLWTALCPTDAAGAATGTTTAPTRSVTAHPAHTVQHEPVVLRVASLNLHNNPAAVDAVRRLLRVSTIGLAEASRQQARLHTQFESARPGYRRVVGPHTGGHRNLGQDTTILTRATLPHLASFAVRVSDPCPGAAYRVAPARWFTGSAFTLTTGLRVLHLHVHPNAGPSVLYRPSARSCIVREYGRSMHALDGLLGRYEALGYTPIVSGDYNLRPTKAGRSVPWSIYRVFARHGLTWRTDRIDGIAYDPRVFTMTGWRVFPAGVVHSDHPGILASLTTRPARR